jgi:DNA invertase Pin-like site-specific DNA recombinase
MESLDENGKETFVTNIIISIYGELAQEERRILTERVKSGMNNAKLNGKQIGRTKGTVKDDGKLLKEYSKLVIDIKNGLSLNQCVKVHSVSKNTVIKIKKLL